MSHRPFSRDDEGGSRPWSRDNRSSSFGDGEDRKPRFSESKPWARQDHGSSNTFERKPWQRRDDDRGGSSFGDRKPWQRRDDDRGGSSFGDRKPWQRRDDDRGGSSFGDRKPWQRRDDDRGGSSFGDRKPWQRRDDDRGGSSFGDRKPWQRRDDDRGGSSFGDRKPWQRRDDDRGGSSFGDRKPPFIRRDDNRGGSSFGDRKPWGRRDDDRGGRSFGDRKPWGRRDDDRGGRSFGDRKPWGRRDDDRGGSSFGDRKPWGRRDDDRGGFRHDREEAEVERKPKFPPAPEGELIYGRQPVRELLRAGRRNVRELILADGIKESDDLAEIQKICAERSVEVKNYTRETLDAWLNAANHQGVVVACDEYNYAEFDEIFEAVKAAEGNALVVILDHVVDPQNLGSLMRSCEAAGVLGVVIPADRAVGVTPAAVRASAGAAEHLKIAMVPSLVTAMEKFKSITDTESNTSVWTTGLEALPESKPYTQIDFKGKVALVIGSEGQGLSQSVREHCDFLAKLPMYGKVESLNAGVAGALAMYEVLRQQGK